MFLLQMHELHASHELPFKSSAIGIDCAAVIRATVVALCMAWTEVKHQKVAALGLYLLVIATMRAPVRAYKKIKN